MRLSILTLLLISPPALVAAEPSPTLSRGERNALYEEHGMEYAKPLTLELDGSPEDELRSKKTEALNHKVRERSIRKLEDHLVKAKDQRIRRELLHRLSQLHEQQAEIISRRSDIKDKTPLIQASLRSANRHLVSLRREFPNWAPDATLFNLAENHAKLKEDPQAEKYYREVIARFPKSVVVADSLLSLGNLYFERQAFFTARNFYGRILETPEAKLYPYAHYKLAWCYFNEQDLPSAVARLELAIHESRKLQQNGDKKLGVEDEALSDLVLFFAEYGNPSEAKDYFEKLVSKERANELRFQLARRLFDHGQHASAKNVAKELLDEGPQKEFVNKLYLILISVAERTKDRDFGLKTAENLSGWLKKENLEKADIKRTESEEYMRHYSQKLHYEAETLKQKEVWSQARKSYEIYLETFPDEAETPEVKFRYAVLLMNRKEQLKAYQSVTEAVAKMDSKHPRFQEALKLRIQSIEMAPAADRKQIDDRDLLQAYDAYAKNFPKEELAVEAMYKAAGLAKNLEQPEQAAARFRAIADSHPSHNLAKASVAEALAVLVKAQKWEALGNESRSLSAKAGEQGSLLEKDDEMKKKIAEARELSLVKITEGLESEGKFAEAKAQYEKILGEAPSESMGIYAYVRLAGLAEQKLQQNRDAIEYFKAMREKYPAAKESRQATLELARLHEKVHEPREAVRWYQEFAGSQPKDKVALQALTNAAVLLESVGDREAAADIFFRLQAAGGAKEAAVALEAGCNNLLLSTYQSRDSALMKKVHDCARTLSQGSRDTLLWQARAAWALEQMASDSPQARERWEKIASRSLKSTPEGELAYVAMAKLKQLDQRLADFRTLKFSKTNERPEANIGKKTQAMAEIEKAVESLVKVGTPKQVLAARNLLRLAYLDFAEAMETAALPSTLSEADQVALKKSFLTFAQEFKAKGEALNAVGEGGRGLASVAPAAEEISLGSLSRDENKMLENGVIPAEKAAELYAKKAYSLYRDGKFGDARYFTDKWRQQLGAGSVAGYGTGELQKFQAMLAAKLPDADPMSKEF